MLRRDEPAATEMLQRFVSGQPLEPDASALRALEVLNGNGISGSAAAAAQALEGAGYSIVRVGDADRKDFPSTVIIVRPGDFERAEVIVQSLGYGVIESGTLADGVDAVVIVGADFAGF